MTVLTSKDIPQGSTTYEIDSNITGITEYCFMLVRSSLRSFSFKRNPQLGYIGKYAFESCKQLKIIDLSPCSKLIAIAQYAFQSCTGVTVLKLPENLERIEQLAFSNIGISSVKLPNSVTKISYRAFVNCVNLSNFEIQAGSLLQTILEAVFEGANITKLFFPKTLKYVAGQGINNIDLTIDPENPYLYYKDGIVYRDNNKTIAWCNSNTITNLTHGDEIKTIGDYAFSACKSLKYINILKVDTFAFSAFRECSSLISLNVTSVNKIEGYAFYNCSNLKYVHMSNITDMKSYELFGKCYNIISFADFKTSKYQAYNNMLIDIEKSAVLKYAPASPTKEIEINCSIIDFYAFMYSKYLEKIILNNTVSISYGSLGYCEKLTTLIVPKTLKSVSDSTFQYSKIKCVIVECDDEEVKKILIAAKIPKSSFDGCINISTKRFKALLLRITPFIIPIFISLTTLRI